jgi:hypothetical protein
MSDKKDNSGEVNRRRLLRGAGVAVAGAVGAGVAASVATPADAASGDAVLAGKSVDAGTDTTTITTSNGTNATLVLNNTAGPTLQFGPTSSLPGGSNGSPAGTVIGDQYGNLFTNQTFTDGLGNNFNFYTRVMTDGWATQVQPIDPIRALDTRDPKLSGGLLSGSRDSTGRLVAGTTAILDISNRVNGATAAQMNVTVVNAAAAGFVTIWSGAGTRPNASTVNYAASAALSNYTQTIVGFVNDTNHDVFGIFTSQNAHVIIDLIGFVVQSPTQITNNAVKSAAVTSGNNPARVHNLVQHTNRPQVKL